MSTVEYFQSHVKSILDSKLKHEVEINSDGRIYVAVDNGSNTSSLTIETVDKDGVFFTMLGVLISYNSNSVAIDGSNLSILNICNGLNNHFYQGYATYQRIDDVPKIQSITSLKHYILSESLNEVNLMMAFAILSNYALSLSPKFINQFGGISYMDAEKNGLLN